MTEKEERVERRHGNIGQKRTKKAAKVYMQAQTIEKVREMKSQQLHAINPFTDIKRSKEKLWEREKEGMWDRAIWEGVGSLNPQQTYTYTLRSYFRRAERDSLKLPSLGKNIFRSDCDLLGKYEPRIVKVSLEKLRPIAPHEVKRRFELKYKNLQSPPQL